MKTVKTVWIENLNREAVDIIEPGWYQCKKCQAVFISDPDRFCSEIGDMINLHHSLEKFPVARKVELPPNLYSTRSEPRPNRWKFLRVSKVQAKIKINAEEWSELACGHLIFTTQHVGCVAPCPYCLAPTESDLRNNGCKWGYHYKDCPHDSWYI